MKIFNRREHLQFIDFSASSYLSVEHGLSPCDLGKVIHARWSDETVITGVEVLREMWEAVGFGALARLARRPTINKLLVRAYAWFAKKTIAAHRPRLMDIISPKNSRASGVMHL